MTIAISNNALESCNSLEEVVELINNEFATDAEPEEIAAAYAVDAADVECDEMEICAHLDILRVAGAIFDYPKALEEALKHS